MRRIALCSIIFALAACASADANQPAEMAGWKMASGKTPTKAEFAAVLAACETKAVATTDGKPLDTCLDNLGLKRAE
jgi:hypothetical protein